MLPRSLRLLIFSFILLASCSGEQVAYQPTPTHVIATSTSTPLPTLTPQPTATIVPTITVSPIADVIQPPLPDLLLNIARGVLTGNGYKAHRPFICYDQYSKLGEIWLSEYPYSKSSPLLFESNIGYYDPVWSPDGKWIAYVAINVQNSQTSLVPNNNAVVVRDFPASDSMWVINFDGTNKKRVSDMVLRREVISQHATGPSCDVIGGITESRISWSANSKWLSFVHSSALYVSNLETGQTSKLTTVQAIGIGYAKWSHVGEKLAVPIRYENSSQGIEIFDFEKKDLTSVVVTIPTVLYQSRISNFNWSKNNPRFLFFEAMSTREPSHELWRFDLVSGDFKEVATLGKNILVGLSSDWAITCDKSSVNLFSLNLVSTLATVMPREPTSLYCSTLIKDKRGNDILVFETDSDDVWGSVALSPSLKPTKIFARETLGLFEKDRIISLSWHP